MWICPLGPHLPLWHHLPWASCSPSCDAIWPLKWLKGSRDICHRLAPACSVLSASGWPPFLHSGLLFHTKGKRLTQESSKGYLGDETLLGQWLWVILEGTWGGKTTDLWQKLQCIIGILKVAPAQLRPPGFCKSQILVGQWMQSSPRRDQTSYAKPHGWAQDGSS